MKPALRCRAADNEDESPAFESIVEIKLRTLPFEATHVLVSGANGYVGALVVASLLRDTAAHVTCLVRGHHDRAEALAPLIAEWQHQAGGARWSPAVERRLTLRRLPDDLADLPDLAPEFGRVDEIVHAAGCVDYHDTARLRSANLLYTAHLLALGRRLRVARFVYVSSAFAGGYRDAPLPEALLDEPPSDPTPYTRSKRQAERLVAAGGLPWLILRPSILIGDSASGRYTGKRYGLVQQWATLTELLCDQHRDDVHVVSGPARPNLLHQDAFCAAFKSAHRWLPDGACANLVSDDAQLPTLEGLWRLWFELVRPTRVHLYASVNELPLRRIDLRQRTYLTFARVNLQIAAHAWGYQTGWLTLLRERGLRFTSAELASVRRCQALHAASTPALAQYLQTLSADAPLPIYITTPPVGPDTTRRAA